MRLTLRTLLAYLDDRLSSANAREIGKKLKDSPFAQDLADRIRTVVRQRRLTTPGRKVKMIDPNLIAEYLDDQLTPELVSLIEKEVLSSDFSLAEVAASHEIIGLLGDPAELDDRLRERLVKQSPYRSAEESTDHEVEQIAQKQLSDPSQEIWKPMARQRPFSPRSPALILAALLVGWLVLLLTDRVFLGNTNDRQSAQVDPGSEPEDDRSEQDDPADQSTDADETDVVPGSEVAPEAPTPDSDTNTEPDSVTVDAPPADPEPGVADADDGTSPVEPPAPEPAEPMPADEGDGDPADTPDTAASPVESEGDSTEPVVVREPESRREFDYAVEDPHSILLSRLVDGEDWARAAVLQGDRTNWHDVLTQRVLALAEPFSSEVTPIDAGWSATFLAPCLFRFGDGVRPQLQLFDGRCIIRRNLLNELQAGDGFDLMAGGASVRCRIAGEDFRLGVLVIPADAVEPADGEADADDQKRLPLSGDAAISLFVADGSLSLQAEGAEPVEIGKGRAVLWTTTSGKPGNVVLSEPTQLDAIPDWVHTADGPGIPEIETVKGKIAKSFQSSDAPIETARELSSDRNPLVARYATSVLSVTRSADTLVQVLLQTDEEQVRIEAIHGVRQTAAQTLAGWKTVSRALENRLPRRDLEDFVILLRGFSQAEAEDEATSQWIIGMLAHDRAAVRQLAILNLMELTGERNTYHPDSDRTARGESIRRWERWLKRNGNRLRASE